MGALRIVTSWTSPTSIWGRRWIETVSCSAVATSGRPADSCTAGREALPYYDLQLESARARGFDLPKGVFLVGNYVAGIGLPMVLEQAAAVATRVREMA